MAGIMEGIEISEDIQARLVHFALKVKSCSNTHPYLRVYRTDGTDFKSLFEISPKAMEHFDYTAYQVNKQIEDWLLAIIKDQENKAGYYKFE